MSATGISKSADRMNPTVEPDSFGKVITSARKGKGWSQKQLAEAVHNEDGKTISPQYLNDLERDRRNPPSDYLLDQLATALDLPRDYLDYWAGRMPHTVRGMTSDPQKVEAAFQAFRRELSRRD
jgi:transcriptional regulator with XRE-family HTH domain